MNDQNHHEMDAASGFPEPEHYLTVDEAKAQLRQLAVVYPDSAESMQFWITVIEKQASYDFWDALSPAKKHGHLQHPIELATKNAIAKRQRKEEIALERKRKDARNAMLAAKRRAAKLSAS